MLDKESAQELAKTLKIDLFTIYREYLQLLFLKYFYSQKGSEKVYFKEGTALRFLYGSFRFSEDLDFTALLIKKEIVKLTKKTVFNLKKEAGELKFKEMESIADSFSGKLYQTLPEFKFPLTVRLDFSFREKPFFVDTSYIETPFPVGPYPQVSHLKIEELMAEKIRAILTRTRGRDIFDLWFILSKKIPINWDLVNKKMTLYKKKVSLDDLIKSIEKFPQKEIKDDLTKFLPFSHRNLVEKIKDLTLEKLKMLKWNKILGKEKLQKRFIILVKTAIRKFIKNCEKWNYDKKFTLHDLPQNERPRERLKRVGIDNLSLQELLALVIERGKKGENVLSIAQNLLAHFGSLEKIKEAEIEELQKVKGIGFATACKLKATFKLGEKALEYSKRYGQKIESPKHAKRILLLLEKQIGEYEKRFGKLETKLPERMGTIKKEEKPLGFQL